ncbi:hypothetical protein LUZ63_001110 [Rhynchospora breviuscula]|uniref:R13L1/DRL21-like LRR repeat region domain-containing protein n=1 Tax=Rhynchospora breviuscula TaxID=2022672 RepID=A0A9Q0CW86_9POAL|nr:hypothetical protein LUZ63_001110 [Rhynchospora breviuscula]
METKNQPKSIENLTHLRFLDLSSTGIEELSQSLFNDHYHLQSLHIRQPELERETQLVKLPKGINKLINLRHLNADAITIAQISSIGQLVDLQELDEYRVGETKGHKITELKNLRELSGRLTIMNCENVRSKEEAEQARLADKENLNSVVLYWSDGYRERNIDMEILEGLKPYKGITELTIGFYRGRSFPGWMTDGNLLPNLQTIYLKACFTYNLQVLPPLGQLPSLKRLHLSNIIFVKKIDDCFYGTNQTAFPALTHFVCSGLGDCIGWTKPTGFSRFFPHLSTLEINGALTLREAPLHCFSASLKALKITGCPHLKSLAEYLHHLTSLNLLHVHDYEMSISLNTNSLMLLEDLVLVNCRKLSIGGDLQSLSNLKRLEIRSCPELISKQKGKNLEVHQANGLLSLSELYMDKSREPALGLVAKSNASQVRGRRFETRLGGLYRHLI